MPTAHAAVQISPRALSAPRRDAFYAAWFHQLGAAEPCVVRLGVTADDALDHLQNALSVRALSRVRFSRLDLSSLAIAVAAARDDEDAWRQIEALSPLLSRALLGVSGGGSPAALAQRFLKDVREATERRDGTPRDLRRYSGGQPLRLYLVDALFGSPRSRGEEPRDLVNRESLRRAVGLLDLQRDRVRSVVGIESEQRVHRLLTDD